MSTIVHGNKDPDFFDFLTDDVRLKECAHCGNNPTWAIASKWAMIKCPKCKMKVEVDLTKKDWSDIQDNKQFNGAWLHAIIVWNRRPN